MKKQIKIFVSSIAIDIILGIIISFLIWQSYQKPEYFIWGATINPIKIAMLLYFITIPIVLITAFLLFKSIKNNKINLSIISSLIIGIYWICLVFFANLPAVLD